MPAYFFWGEDDFRLQQAVQKLRARVLDPDWAAFNYDRLPPEAIWAGLSQAMTAPFGLGERLVWLEDSRIAQQCSEDLLRELERTLRDLPTSSHLLFTSSAKPDGRLRSTKLLKQHAQIEAFPTIPPWDADALLRQVQATASAQGLGIAPEAAERLAAAIGNDTRRLAMELDKLALFLADPAETISADLVQQLVPTSAANSFQLAGHLIRAEPEKALDTLEHLLGHNEPALRIVAVLVGQFRTWLWVKLLVEARERDPKAIAQAAEISNPNRVYFLQKEVQPLASKTLHQALRILLEIEWGLKQGQPERLILQTGLVRLAETFRPG